MNFNHFVILVFALALGSCDRNVRYTSSGIKVRNLKLVNAYEVETLGKFDPSGLTYWDGQFFTVSDKDNFIFKLKFDDNKVRLIPFLEIENDKPGKLDFEGITHDDEYFYLISELHFQILKISKDGKNQQWIPDDESLKIAGKESGLFTTHNAYIEGICLLEDQKFLLAAERQPRGFIEIDVPNNEIKAYQQNDAVFEYQANRSTDFSGLSCNNDKIYVLDRNAETIASLERQDGKFVETSGYSYGEVINQPEFSYLDKEFGLAEGLYVSEDRFYILLDNNRIGMTKDPENNNSLFLELEK